MTITKIGEQFINLDAIAAVSPLQQGSEEEGPVTYVVVEMIGGSAITLFGKDAIAFIAFLENQAQEMRRVLN